MRAWALMALLSVLILAARAPGQASRAAEHDTRTARWIERAEAHLRAGRPQRARILLRRAQRNSPADARPLIVAGTLLRAGTDARRDAQWLLDKAAGVAPRDEAETHELQRNVAWARAWLGDANGALRAMPAGEQDPQTAQDLQALAAWWIARGSLRPAQRALEHALRAMPQDPSLPRDLAAVLLARGRPDAAVRLLRGHLQTHPNDEEARRDLAGALLATGRESEALRTYRTLARTGEDEARLDLADALLELGHAAEAAEVARRTSPSPRHWTILGLALLTAGQRREAQEALRRAPNDPRARQALRTLDGPPRSAQPGDLRPRP